jgi:glycosyltransferase involved in cell wall biosynthesis
MTLVSAVTPTYDRADYIEGAIATVREQSHEPMEHVIVVDGSTDGTREVLADYADDPDLRVLYNDRNRGIAYSFDRAVRAAEGEYVAILGDDDRWRPRKTERQLAAMERLPELVEEPERYCGVYTAGVRKGADGTTDRIDTGAAGDLWPEILVANVLIPDSSKLMRRDCVLEVGGFDTDFPHAVDWDLGIRLAREYRWAYLPAVLMERAFHDDNVSGDLRFGDPAYEVEAKELVYEKYRDVVDEHVRGPFLGALEKQRGLAALEEGDRLGAVGHLARAVRHDPSATVLATLALSALGPEAYRSAWRLNDRLG